MAYKHAWFLFYVLMNIFNMCHTYYIFWSRFSGKNVLRHTLIGFLVGNATIPLIITIVAACSTEFRLSAEYVLGLTSCVSGAVGRVLFHAFILSSIPVAIFVGLVKYGPLGDLIIDPDALKEYYKEAIAAEYAKVHIRIQQLEEMLQIEEQKEEN